VGNSWEVIACCFAHLSRFLLSLSLSMIPLYIVDMVIQVLINNNMFFESSIMRVMPLKHFALFSLPAI
jgi:hypothetical protein